MAKKKEMKKFKFKLNKKAGKIIALTAVVGALSVGGTMAYLTDYDKTVNEFTVGKVTIELQEPNWKPEDNTKIEPTQVIKKDPKVKNTGVNDAFVYLEVSIPTKSVITASTDGHRNPQKPTELFTFAKKADWTQLSCVEKDGYHVYTFCYNKVLKAGETSSTLFDTVTFANIIEGQLDTQQLDIPVKAFAIQTMNTGDNKGTIPQQAAAAFKKYVNQNEGQGGAVTAYDAATSTLSDPAKVEGPSAGDTGIMVDPVVPEGPSAGA